MLITLLLLLLLLIQKQFCTKHRKLQKQDKLENSHLKHTKPQTVNPERLVLKAAEKAENV